MYMKIFWGWVIGLSLVVTVFFVPYAESAEETAESKSYYSKGEEYALAVKEFFFSEYSRQIGYEPSEADIAKARETFKKLHEYCPAMTSKKCVIAAVSISLSVPLTSYIMECKDEAKICLDKFVDSEQQDKTEITKEPSP